MKRFGLVIVALLTAVPALAGAVAHEITLPVAGQLVLPGKTYVTELTVTNHRDVAQNIAVEVVDGRGPARFTRSLRVEPRETLFLHSGWISSLVGTTVGGSAVGALRFHAIIENAFPDDYADLERMRDRAGALEVKAHIVNERGPFGVHGSSRQEIEGIPVHEYTAKENVFVGVLHQPPTYTNVGIVNLHPTETVTFYVRYQYLEPVAVTVPPSSSQQVRIAGGRSPNEEGNAGRYVVVTPEWANDGSGRTTPWVAYASTIDGLTGDAFSGIRVPPGTKVDR